MPDSVKAGLWTAVFVFVTGVLTTLVGWLNDVGGWFADGRADPFPDPSVLVGTVGSAGVALAVAAINIIVRYLQDRFHIGPDTPTYTAPGDVKVS